MIEEYLRLDIQAAITHQNAYVGRRNLGNAVEKAHRNGLNPWRLLYEVLQNHFEPKEIMIESQNHKIDQIYVCQSCQQPFKTQAALAGHGPHRCQNRKTK
jgi:hypothetical protein